MAKQLKLDFDVKGKNTLDYLFEGMTPKKIRNKFSGMDITRKIIFLEDALEQVNNPEVKKAINVSLGESCIKISSLLGYGSECDRNRMEYLLKAIKAYENAGFYTGTVSERKRLYGLYQYAQNICLSNCMLKEAVSILEKMPTLGKSCGIIKST